MNTDAHSFDDAIAHLESRLTPDARAQIDAVYAFAFSDGNSATLDARSPQGSGWEERPPTELALTPDFEVTISRDDFVRLVFGELHPMAGMATGRMRIKGSMKEAIKLDRLMKS
jgi:hypothetical protein